MIGSEFPGESPADVFRAFAELLSAGRSSRRCHAIALLDIDRLAHINRACGWSAGGAVLNTVSVAITQSLEHRERAAHWSGDQYIVLLPGKNRHAARRRIRRILDRVNRIEGPGLLSVSCSAGVAAYPADGTKASELVEAAAAALRRAKRDGRGCVRS